MAAKPTPDPATISHWLDHAPSPIAVVRGADHSVHFVNPEFCRLLGASPDQVLGRPFCELAPEGDDCQIGLDEVRRTGQPTSLVGWPGSNGPRVFILWPTMAGDGPPGIVIQVDESSSLQEKTLAMNEALLLGSLRQHELAEAADRSNQRLQEEIAQRIQSERDALMLTREISHRIKNNLQTFFGLIAEEIRRTPAEYAEGYVAMQARIGAIAELYDLISQSGERETVVLGDYLEEIAHSLAASLLEPASAIRIEVVAQSATIETARAEPFGLLVNELGTNAIKHAFPGGAGTVRLGLEVIGEELELTVADDGVGFEPVVTAPPGRHGSDYVAIFVRQLGGAIAVESSAGGGTTVRVRLPASVARIGRRP
ncbi:MAG TPA: histidine kinase dimerization/phosphoacceptor domain -containing protein [Phenylobacterium sp.]|nr:histidine kinase dimerization/phosphoacceptor domain -containing protein [Phenylobacterium sp.]